MPRRSRRPLVLIVDDDARSVGVLAKLLDQDGFAVEIALDGAAAIGRLASGLAPDALITDFSMPRADGFAVAAFARQLWPALPVIVVTGYPAAMARPERALAPPARVIEKPLDYTALRDALQDLPRRASKGRRRSARRAITLLAAVAAVR